MSDRELLEFAAKAAGYALKWGQVYMVGGDEIDCTDQPYVASGQPDEADWYWDPLNDDGDALRLAVTLEMNVFQSAKSAYALPSDDDGTYEEQVRYTDAGSDPCAATRRAIVRAAAAIGKDLP